MEVDFRSDSRNNGVGKTVKPQVGAHDIRSGLGTVCDTHPVFMPLTCAFMGGISPPWRYDTPLGAEKARFTCANVSDAI